MRMTIITDISEYFNLSGTFREADAIAEITNGYEARSSKRGRAELPSRPDGQKGEELRDGEKENAGRTQREREQTARAPAGPALLSSITH
jgi:hypothetical protein